jgi:CRP-like cAMP-binding protein
MSFLQSGTAKAIKDGNVVKEYTEPGSYFGELALLDPTAKRQATIQAGNAGCTLLLLDKETFDRLLGPLQHRMGAEYISKPMLEPVSASELAGAAANGHHAANGNAGPISAKPVPNGGGICLDGCCGTG